MKRATVISVIVFLMAMSVFAAKTENLTLGVNESKVARTGKINVKFEQVVEDSRCPEGTNCVWAGNAKVKISVSTGKAGKSVVYELNSTMQPNIVTFKGYDIKFVDLTPHPSMSKVAVRNQQLTVSITRHKKA